MGFIAAVQTAAPPARAQSFEGIGFLPGYGESTAEDLSANGSVIVGDALFQARAVRWTSATGLVDLGTFTGGSGITEALGVNADGTVVVGYDGFGGVTTAFRWTSATGPVSLGFAPNSDRSVAYSVNADGAVVVGDSPTTSTNQAARWTAGTGWVSLGFLPGHDRSQAFGVNGNGKVVVGTSYHPNGTREAFRWTAAGMVGIGVVPGMISSYANDVSADGGVIVGVSEGDGGARQAFRWTAATGMVGLPFEDARRVNACGNVVVGADEGEAVRWTPWKGVEDIDRALLDAGASLDTWQLRIATGLSADGVKIAGRGTDPEGGNQGWIASLPLPETRKPGQMCKLYRWKRFDSYPGPFASEQQCRSYFRALKRSCAKG